MEVSEPRLLWEDQEVVTPRLVKDAHLALLDEVYLVDTLVEVDYDFVRLEDTAVHAHNQVVLKALLGLLEEELHVVGREVREEGLYDLVLEVGRKAVKEVMLVSDQVEVVHHCVLNVPLYVLEEPHGNSPLLV